MVSMGYFPAFPFIIIEYPKLSRKVCGSQRTGSSSTQGVHQALCTGQTRQQTMSSCLCVQGCTTGVSPAVQVPQFQVSSLLERDMTFKQAEGKWKGVDQTVTPCEIRTWTFCFVKHGVLPSPVRIYSHHLPIKASFEVSQISQDMWIYGIHSSSPCWDKAAWSRLGCTDAENLQKISQIPIPQKPPGSKHFLMPLAPKKRLFTLFLIAP